MKNLKLAFVIAGVALMGLSLPASAAQPAGKWVRPNGDITQVSQHDGLLYCKIIKGKTPGFEMCNGMKKAGQDVWQGGGMKHPGMPSFMTFNGTVTVQANTLNIKGCAVGQTMCDSENWKRVN